MSRPLALLLTFATGVAGLVYEVAWQKYLATLLGSQASATAAVLGIFLGGLSAGYALFGAVSRRVGRRPEGRARRLLRVYGAVELGIGGLAFLFPLLFAGASALSGAVAAPAGGPGFAFDVALGALLIGPPTVLMGATIPLLTQALAHDLGDATRVHARIYAANTAGAFGGALLGGFVLVPWLGLDGVLRAMGLVNLAAGALFVGLAPAAAGGVLAEAPRAERLGARQAAFGAVACLAGFAMMTLQILLNRIGALALGSSHFTFAMVVAVFVLCLALGSFGVGALRRISPALVAGSQWTLVGLLALLYPRLPDATYHAYLLRGLFGREASDFYAFHLAAFGAALLVLAVPIGLAGALLPLLFHQLRRELGALGSAAGRLYSWNTVGSLAGALLGGYLLLFWLDLHHVYRLAVGALVVAAALLTLLVARRLPAAAVGLAAAAGLAGLAVLPAWDPVRLDAGLFRLRPDPSGSPGADAFFERAGRVPVVFHDDDPVASIAVRHSPRHGRLPALAVFSNGKSDGSLLEDHATMALAALLPALFCDSPQRSFVVGFGTGVTVGELAALEESREVVVAEISPAVMRAAPLFEPGNLEPTRSPRVRVVESDAYRALLRSRERFDVIVSMPSNPWVTGVEMLFSVEFLGAARERLTPRGVYAQWLQLYETDAEVVALVLRGYASVFPEVSVWFTEGADVILLGFRDASLPLDPERIAGRFVRPDFRAGFARSGIRSLDALLAHELLPVGVVHADLETLAGPLHRLHHPILSDRAARAFFAGRYAELPRGESGAAALAGARSSLLGRRLARPGDGPAETVLLEATLETCRRRRDRECATLAARWAHDHPGSERLARALAALRARAGPQALPGERLELLAGLFDDGARPLPPPAERLYRLHYHHAVPFRPLEPARAPEG